MTICPRCAQQVDETTRSTCPHCFTPLAAVGSQPGAPPAGQTPPGQPYAGTPPQPQPPPSYAPQLSRSAGTRVSLTGEVIEDRAPSAPPSYVGGGAPGSSVGLAKPQRAHGASLSEAPTKSGGSPIVAILIGLVVLGGLGAGGWWFLMPHSNPKTVVQKFDTAIAAQDWKSLYDLVEMSAESKAKYPSADAFASSMSDQLAQARSNPLAGQFVDAFTNAYRTAQVGEPTINGDTATVPVTLTVSLSFMGKTSEKTSTQQVPLHKVNGAWKIDGMQGALSGAGVPGGK